MSNENEVAEMLNEEEEPEVVDTELEPEPVEPEETPAATDEQTEVKDSEPEADAEVELEPDIEPEKDVRTVPIHALHEARLENHELRNEVAELKKVSEERAVVEEPKEDIDPYVALLEDDPDAVASVADQLAHEEWVNRQSAATAYDNGMKASTAAEELIKAEYTTEKMGDNLDYETVTRVGVNYLTAADRVQITSNPDRVAAGKMLYSLCIKRCPVLNILTSSEEQQTTTTKPKGPGKLPAKAPVPESLPTIDEVITGPQSVVAFLSE